MLIWIDHGELWPLMLQAKKGSRTSIVVDAPAELIIEWIAAKKRFLLLNEKLYKLYAKSVKVTPKRLGV